ncbi:hypothetical protein GS597_08085 [Synechococcales cyanobacterium C]|uniref:Uncharacterized protein n=1 Tax=Petrachloros mirabilis ULC683 TaxID=2781853 RepID=A0A8K2A7Z5_9CYAN|nr:hypothetical protein [Petrachloros mirabilis]NCJ06470.1 hypothetical protein [Petrachloros mirabilis ULC683]
MAIIGVLSGAGGYIFGRESLKGVTQPLLNPFLNSSQDPDQAPRQGSDFLNEGEIIARIRAQTSGVEQQNTDSTPSKSPSSNNSSEAKSTEPTTVTLPTTVEDQGIRLEIRSVTQNQSDLTLNVALQNTSENPTQFLYSFIDVVDDQGRDLPTETLGLPAELAPKSDVYIGTIKVEALGSGVKSLSLTLADYPQQSVKLEVADIPVKE